MVIFINYMFNKKIIKILFFILLISNSLILNTAYAEINSEKWSLSCADIDNKEGCIIGIHIELENKKILSTAYIQLGSTTENKMVLVNEDEQTYKLDKTKTNIPVLFVNLPLNVDLRRKPLVVVDDAKEKIGDLSYMHCNNNLGCKAMIVFNEKSIELLQKGKVLKVYSSIFGNKKPLLLDFSLKGFSKAYKNL